MKRPSHARQYPLESLELRRLLTTYTVDLGMPPGGGYGEAVDINASGHVAGTVRRSDGYDRAFIWRNGVMSDLGTLLGGLDSQAYGINDAGQVVGQSFTNSGGVFAWRAFLVTPEDTDGNGAPDRWFRDSNSDGKNDLMSDLGSIGGSLNRVVAYDVNNLGQVVGTASSSGSSASRAFRWQNGIMTDLGLGNGSEAYAINDAGQIAGRFISGGQSHAFLWKADVATDLGVSNGPGDINAAGQVVDSLGSTARIWTPTVSNGATGTFVPLGQLPADHPDGEVSSYPSAINAAAQVVGSQAEAFYSETTNGISNAGVRWVNRAPEWLPLESAAAINDTGQIVGTLGGRAVLLANENFPVPMISIGDATVTEGNSGTSSATVTVSLTRAWTVPITVHYATSDITANAGSDYVATSGTLTFAPGQTTRTIAVPIIGDREGEYGEFFHATLTNSTDSIIVDDVARVTIAEDEPAITANRVTVIEGNAGSANALLTVSLSRAYDQTIVVGYDTRDGTATAGSDYVAGSGTMTFAPGQTVKQMAVMILGDRVAEMTSPYDGYVITTEDVYVGLYSPSGNAYSVSGGAVIIQDDEPTLSLRGGSVSEGDAGTTDLVFTVTLSKPYDQEVAVGYRTIPNMYFEGYEDAMASAESDYVTTAGTVRFAPGQTSRTVRVPVLGDIVDEPNEYFSLGIQDQSGNAWIDEGYRYAAGEIRDDDGPTKIWIGPASGGNWSTAANWSPSGVPAATDFVRIAGKAVTLSSSATVANLALTGGAALTVATDGGRVLRTSSLAVSSDSALNLNDNSLIIDYAVASPMTETAAWLTAGRGAGGGPPGGIYSPQANASAGARALGVAEAVDALALVGAQAAGPFAGQSVDATTVLVRYTLAADANLDRTVNFSDLLALAKNYNGTGKAWAQGDFDGDGSVKFADLLTLAKNYNKALPAAGAATLASTVDAGALAAAMGIAVPTSPNAKPTPAPAPAQKPELAPRPVAKPATPTTAGAKATAVSVLREDEQARTVFSTTRVAKATPVKLKAVVKAKGR